MWRPPVVQDDPSQGDAQLVNSAYLDNDSAELYHGRLDKKPNALALRLRWCALLMHLTSTRLSPRMMPFACSSRWLWQARV